MLDKIYKGDFLLKTALNLHIYLHIHAKYKKLYIFFNQLQLDLKHLKSLVRKDVPVRPRSGPPQAIKTRFRQAGANPF